MRPKRGRRANAPPDGGKKDSSVDNMETPDLSAIGNASFLEGLQRHHGNPMHSTAMEQDLDVSQEAQEIRGTQETAAKQREAAVKRKRMEEEEEKKKKNAKKGKRGSGGKVGARSAREGGKEKKQGAPQRGKVESDGDGPQNDVSPPPAAGGPKRVVRRKPAKRRNAAARPVKTQPVKKKNKKTTSESGSGNSSDLQSQEDSDSGSAQQSRARVLSSDDEEVVEDQSWVPSPKKARVLSLGRSRKSLSARSKSRKSSSGSASAAEPEEADTAKQRERGRGRGHGGGTELEVVLDAFLDFCDQHRESVASKAIRDSINWFSSNVKEQLLEKITSSKGLRALTRESTKMSSLIRKKTQRLLDVKHELMRAERQLWLLHRDIDDHQLRLADLKQGQAFLHDIRVISRDYQAHRHKHPKQKQTYGESSLPALLLEAKHIQTAEHPLRGINKRLEKRLKKDGARK